MKSYREQINELAIRSDEPIRSRLFEYALLHAELSVLTGVSEPNEAGLPDVLNIDARSDRERATVVAARMRRLSRALGSSLKV